MFCTMSRRHVLHWVFLLSLVLLGGCQPSGDRPAMSMEDLSAEMERGNVVKVTISGLEAEVLLDQPPLRASSEARRTNARTFRLALPEEAGQRAAFIGRCARQRIAMETKL